MQSDDGSCYIVYNGEVYNFLNLRVELEAKGYACIGVYEASENPSYHQTADTIDRIEMSHLAEVTKMVLATLLQMTQ